MCQYSCPGGFTGAANLVKGPEGCYTGGPRCTKEKKADYYTRCYQNGASNYIDMYCKTEWTGVCC